MRTAQIGFDGILRDADGNPVYRAHKVAFDKESSRRHPFISNRPEPVRRSVTPYSGLSQETFDIQKTLENFDKLAQKYAEQYGVPASQFEYSKLVGDPSKQIYPSRVVYQPGKIGLYSVSFRAPSDPDSVKLFKLTGEGRGHWFEVPLARKPDPKDPKVVLPGLLTDFHVVPTEFVRQVWAFVLIPTVTFEDEVDLPVEERTGHVRAAPIWASEVFQISYYSLLGIPDQSSVNPENIQELVLYPAMSALFYALEGLESAAAAYDVNQIGVNALRLYQRVGSELLSFSDKIIDDVNAIRDGRSSFADGIEKIYSSVDHIRRMSSLIGAYLARAELYAAWTTAIEFGEWDGLFEKFRDVSATILYEIEKDPAATEEVLRKHPELKEDVQRFHKALHQVVNMWDRFEGAYDSELYRISGEAGIDPGEFYSVSYMIPALLAENAKYIKKAREELRLPSRSASLSIVTLGAEPLPAIALPDPTPMEVKRKQMIDLVYESLRKRKEGLRFKAEIRASERALRKFLFEPLRRLRRELTKSLAREVQKAVARGYDVSTLNSYLEAKNDERKRLAQEYAQLKQKKERGEKVDENKLRDINQQYKKVMEDITHIEELLCSPSGSKVSSYLSLVKNANLLDPQVEPVEKLVRAELEIITHYEILNRLVSKGLRGLTKGVQAQLVRIMYNVGDLIPAGVWKYLFESIAYHAKEPPSFQQILSNIDFEIRILKTKLGKDMGENITHLPSRFPDAQKITLTKDKRIQPTGIRIKDEAILRRALSDLKAFEHAYKTLKEASQEPVAKAASVEMGAKSKAGLDELERLEKLKLSQKMPEEEYNTFRRQVESIEAYIQLKKKFIEDIKNKDSDISKALDYPEGIKLKDNLVSIYAASDAQVNTVRKLLGSNYEDFETKDHKMAYKELAKLSELSQDLTNLMRNAEVRSKYSFFSKRKFVDFLARTKSILASALSIGPDSLLLKTLARLKEIGGMPLMSTLGIAVAFAGFIAILNVYSLIPWLGKDFEFARDLLLGIIRRLGALFNIEFGGDPPNRYYPPGARPSSDILTFLLFGLGIAMIAYGKDVFTGLAKTFGGFFTFLTALLPGKKKRVPGAPRGARRGPRIDVEKWLDAKEHAKQRLEVAKAKGDKRAEEAARRDIEAAIKKLRRAEEEGQPIPEGALDALGFWKFKWIT